MAKQCFNIPHTSGGYKSPVHKIIISGGNRVKLDLGFHLYSWRSKQDTEDKNIIHRSNICYVHVHNRAFLETLERARQKLAARVPDFKKETLASYSGAGKHLVRYFFLDHAEYRNTFPEPTVNLHDFFGSAGSQVPFCSPEESIDDSRHAELKSSVNVRAFRGKIRASEQEISLVHRQLIGCMKYIQFGVANFVQLALEMGVESAVVVEPIQSAREGDFLRNPMVQSQIDSGRLKVERIELGPTDMVGRPLSRPAESQIRGYLRLARKHSDCDIALVSGRYKIPVVASVLMASGQRTRVIVHGFREGKKWAAIEELFHVFEVTGSVAVLHPRTGDLFDRAKRIRERYLYDPT